MKHEEKFTNKNDISDPWREYDMDLAAHTLGQKRNEVVSFIQRMRIPCHRRFGNTYVYEDDIVEYKMKEHRQQKGVA